MDSKEGYPLNVAWDSGQGGFMQVEDSQSLCYKLPMESIEVLTSDEAKLLAQKLKIKKLEFDVQEQAQKKQCDIRKDKLRREGEIKR